MPKRAYRTDASGNSIGFDLFTATIDPNTGRAVESCDANGLCQQFSYDDLGRLTQVKDSPSVGSAYKGATVQYSYAYVEAANGGWTTTTDYLCPVGGSTPCDPAEFPQSQTVVSGFGRPHLSRVRHADGSWSKQASLFDAVGNVLKSTTWVPDAMSVASAPGTTFSGHDAFGRPSTITLPDGKVQSQTFVGVRQRTRTAPVAMDITGLESSSSTIETYDRNGRLVRVDEPSMAGGGLANATYEYNVLGKLTRILHSAGANLQTRTWVYDGRGLLVSESAPERVDAVVMGAYDAAGQAGSRTVNDQTLLFAFDRAGRPLTVSKELVGGGSELLQRFTYDTGVGLGLGRLASAESWTRYVAASIGNVHTTEEYEYAGLRGNASAKTTTVAIDGVTAASTTQTYGWSPMGAIRDLGYPSGMTVDDPARAVTHEYDSGFLTAIPGYANSLTYHDNLALASVAHSNGVTDWVGQDPDRMMRPAALWTSGVAAGEDWNSGSYQFDGSGNIKAIGAQRFRYDAVSRLVEAKIWVPENNPPLNSFDDGFETGDACNWEVRNPESGCVAGAHQLGLETYTYDPYGNLIARTTETSDGATQINTPADTQTNRLQGASTYDDEGNMTGWNGAQYDFDALGQMVRMRNGNQDWLFAYSTGGERILQVAEGGLGEKRWTVRDAAGRVLREWVAPAQGEPAWTRDWIYRGGQILATVEPQPEELLDQAEGETSQVVQGTSLNGPVEVIRHLTLDHLGTPRLVTDEAGTNLAFHIYWPYGREASDPLQNELRKKFTGHERDSYDLSSLADELDYMLARFSSSIVDRFLSVDPLAGDLTGPQSLNRFALTVGNPLKFIDPDGRGVVLAPALIGGLVGGGLNAINTALSSETVSAETLLKSFVVGFGSGFVATWAGGGMIVSAAANFVGALATQTWVNNGEIDLGSAQNAAVVGGLLAPIGKLIPPGQETAGAAYMGAVANLGNLGLTLWEGFFVPWSETIADKGSMSCWDYGCLSTVVAEDPGLRADGASVDASAKRVQPLSPIAPPHPFFARVPVAGVTFGLAGSAFHTGDFVGVFDLFLAGGLCIESVCL